VIVMATAALVGERNTAAAGYVFLCLLAGVSYLAVAVAVSLLHAREAADAAGARLGAAVRATVRAPLLLSLAAAPPLVLALSIYPTYAIRAFGW
jgi:hypothetical protein